jgi:hypothetical protein
MRRIKLTLQLSPEEVDELYREIKQLTRCDPQSVSYPTLAQLADRLKEHAR